METNVKCFKKSFSNYEDAEIFEVVHKGHMYDNNENGDYDVVYPYIQKTLIVSVFAGCGKTWLTENQAQYGYSMRDSDSSTYEKSEGWEKRYISNIMEEASSGKYDFVFVCQTESVIDEMDRQGIPYIIVEPDNIIWNENETKERAMERQLIKQQWFGRFALRDNSHIADFSKWLDHIKEIYDERTGLDFINRHHQKSFFVLNQNQYLSDVIKELYWLKEHHDFYTIYSDDCCRD